MVKIFTTPGYVKAQAIIMALTLGVAVLEALHGMTAA